APTSRPGSIHNQKVVYELTRAAQLFSRHSREWSPAVSATSGSDPREVVDLRRAQGDAEAAQRDAPELGVEAHVAGIARAEGEVGDPLRAGPQRMRDAGSGPT